MYFSVKFEKTQEKPKLFKKNLEKTQGSQKKNQEPKIGSENPRSWEKTQGVAIMEYSKFIKSEEWVLKVSMTLAAS